MGNMFLKLPTRQSRTMLAQDQVQLDLTVNLLRSSLKVRGVRTLPEINVREMRGGISVCEIKLRTELRFVQEKNAGIASVGDP
jgi:hypothetical protein